MMPASDRKRLYDCWRDMHQRCYNRKHRNFKWYGARGIAVCKEWRISFDVFAEWSAANGWKPGLEIDREDNDGDYEPGNCRFVTHAVNVANSRCGWTGKGTRSGLFKGVGVNWRKSRWVSRIYIDGKERFLGSFATAEEAARAYDRAALEHFGECARLNFPVAKVS